MTRPVRPQRYSPAGRGEAALRDASPQDCARRGVSLLGVRVADCDAGGADYLPADVVVMMKQKQRLSMFFKKPVAVPNSK